MGDEESVGPEGGFDGDPKLWPEGWELPPRRALARLGWGGVAGAAPPAVRAELHVNKEVYFFVSFSLIFFFPCHLFLFPIFCHSLFPLLF